MGLCHFALALLVLLEVVAQVDTQKMVRAQCGARPRACNSIHFLLLPALPLSHGLQFSQVGRGCPLSQGLRTPLPGALSSPRSWGTWEWEGRLPT